jgi:hypothetical protein
VGPGTIALIAAGIIAFFFAGASMFDNLSRQQGAADTRISAPRPAPDPSSRYLLNDILGQQISTRRDLADLRRALAAQQAERPGQSIPGSRPCPDTCERRDIGPALERIDRYLALIASDANVLMQAFFTEGQRIAGDDIGSRWEHLIQTISEARDYVRTQRRALASAEPAEQPSLFLTATPAPAPGDAGPSAASLAWMKLYIIVGMFLVLGIVFIVAVAGIFVASNPAAVAFATDTVKTMLGFFIGVITAFMGAPG